MSILVILFTLVGCSVKPEHTLVDKYDFIDREDYCLDDSLCFKYVEMNNKPYYVLAYFNDENLEVNTESGYIKSINIGKYCIGLTSCVFDVQDRSNKNVMLDLLSRVRNVFYTDESIILKEEVNIDTPYIVSENDGCYFIDYLTAIPQNNSDVIYYRVIIEDVHNVYPEITSDEYDSLENNLETIIECLGIDISLFE